MTSNKIIEIALDLAPNPDQITKPSSYYEVYQNYFEPFLNKEISIMEVGVFNGESLKILSKFFPKASIIGIDLQMKDIDFSGFTNIEYLEADQINSKQLTDIADEYAPLGFDIIIDDASHIGSFSQKTFESLFPKLNSGGIYVVEDWGTGYWNDWHDGSSYEKYSPTGLPTAFIKRIPSHDFGMVGFVKSLVDLTHTDAIRITQAAPPTIKSEVAYLHFYPGVVILKKR